MSHAKSLLPNVKLSVIHAARFDIVADVRVTAYSKYLVSVASRTAGVLYAFTILSKLLLEHRMGV